MSANPDDGASLAARILAIIAEVERALINMIVTRLRAGIFSPNWESTKLAEIQVLRRRLQTGVQQATPQVAAEVTQIIHDAYNQGQASAVKDLQDAHHAWDVAADPIGAIDLPVRATVDNVTAAIQEAPGLLLNVYQQAVSAGVEQVLGGAVTRVQAAQSVLDDLAERGVTGFRDSAGRNWALESYVEMAVRTGAGHAAIQGHVDTLAASGMDLVIVSESPRECPLCRPWERQILSISGQVGAIIEPSALTGRGIVVNVKAPLATARAAGLFHPQCRHHISAYQPGATIKGIAKSDPEGYEAGQRLREIERNIRKYKRREAVALDEAAARRARAKVREWQGIARSHVAEHDLKRLSRREQIGKAL